ncbi:hypothetical protein BD309DRAFT_129194 [Dichomitus squalens]|nr:hypothetical protein BD309DRAFT_129194 [Dichomitus squalens]
MDQLWESRISRSRCSPPNPVSLRPCVRASSLSSEPPCSLPTLHAPLRCAGDSHQFTMVFGRWSYALLRGKVVGLGQYQLVAILTAASVPWGDSRLGEPSFLLNG